jgi:hypothetical protein
MLYVEEQLEPATVRVNHHTCKYHVTVAYNCAPPVKQKKNRGVCSTSLTGSAC